MEELKGDQPQPKRQGFIEELKEWKKNAPMCACGEDCVVYLCRDEKCHGGDRNKMLYCQVCVEIGEAHQHFRHVRVTQIIQ